MNENEISGVSNILRPTQSKSEPELLLFNHNQTITQLREVKHWITFNIHTLICDKVNVLFCWNKWPDGIKITLVDGGGGSLEQCFKGQTVFDLLIQVRLMCSKTGSQNH